MSRPIGAVGLGVSASGRLLILGEIINPSWHDDALCKGRDLSLYVPRDGDKTEGDIEQYKRTADECLDCPVFFQCKETASKSDHEYAIRAGELPTKLSLRSRGRPRLREKQVINGVCSAGLHVIKSGADLYGTNECKMCGRARRSRSSTHCARGHEMTKENTGWKARGDGKSRRFCRECSRIKGRERDRAARDKEKGAMLVA